MLAPLPLRVTPVTRETPTSFLARMAAVNAVSGRDLAVDMGFSLRKIIDLDETAIRKLAGLGGLDEEGLEELISWAGRNIGGVRMAFRGEVFVSRALRNPQVRGCPVCLREDAAAHDGPFAEAMAMRGDWQLREVSLCIRHHHPLVQLWDARAPLQRFDIGARLHEVADQIFSGDLDHDRVAPSPYDKWLDARLQDGSDDTWLSSQSLYAATTFCRLLGTELLRLEAPRRRDEADEFRAAQAAGFAVARRGEDAIRSALRDLTSLAVGAYDEPRKSFGNLFSTLSRDYVNDDDFEVFRVLLREQVLESWPMAPGETVVGKVLTERRLHSVSTAAREANIPPSLMDRILVDAGAIADNDDRPKARKTFDAHPYASLLEMISQLVGRIQMQKIVGASRAELISLADEGLLVPRIDLPDVRLCWHPDDGRNLLKSLQAKSFAIERCDQAWERIQHAKNRTGVSLQTIFSEVRLGNLQIGCRPGPSGYQAFHARIDEIDALADRLGLLPSAELMPLSSFSWSIGIRARGRLLALVEAGYIPATRKRFQKSGGERYYMTPEDIKTFHKRFVTLSTLAGQTGDHRSAILARLRASDVRPFSPNGENFGNIYLRNEAERALARRL